MERYKMCQFLIGKVQHLFRRYKKTYLWRYLCQFLIGKVQLLMDEVYEILDKLKIVSIPHR